MKTSNPKARTARRFWSILLSLVMVLTMLPTAALADGPDPVSIQTRLPFSVEVTDEAGNELEGVEIELWKKDWQSLGETQPTASAFTDTSGIATFDGEIPAGEYVLWQEALNFPTNYYRDPNEYPVTITTGTGNPDVPVMTFKNPSIMYDLTIPVEKIVTVVGEQGPAPTEFQFQLCRMSDGGEPEEVLDTQSLTADAAGKTEDLTFSFLKSKYTAGSTKLCLVEESGYAAGWTYSQEKYVINSTSINIMSFGDPEPQLDEDGRYHEPFGQIGIEKLGEDGQSSGVEKASFTNTYTYNYIPDWYYGATITVKKEDTAGEPLAGAVFVLENSRGDAVYEAVSNSRGEASFTGVGSGEYTLLEESAPEGYVKSEQSYELSVRGSGVTMDGEAYAPVTFVNRKAAQLNREDHFTFLVGYDGGSFGPGAAQPRGPLHLPRGLRRRLLRPGAEHDACRGDDNVRPPAHRADRGG